MGEIKSTLDLVLEKTRHLTLSSEEKQEQTLIHSLGPRESAEPIFRHPEIPVGVTIV